MADIHRTVKIRDAYLERVIAQDAYLIEDGGFGTMLQRMGLTLDGENPNMLNISDPDSIVSIHAQYILAGSQLITTNTFGANPLKLPKGISVDEVFEAAIANAKKAVSQTRCHWEKREGIDAGAKGVAPYIAADIGPTGSLLTPIGDVGFDEAYDIFKEQVVAAERYGADIIYIETMSDLRESKAAVLAACENTSLPVFVTMTFQQDGRTFLGTSPAIAAATLSALGAAAIGINCSLGPAEILPLIEQMQPFSRVGLIAKPNAGLPEIVDGETVYRLGPEGFAEGIVRIIECGVKIVGGCCGTSPEYIEHLVRIMREKEAKHFGSDAPDDEASVFGGDDAKGKEARVVCPSSVRNPSFEESFVATGAQDMVSLTSDGSRIAIIGEKINPTGNKSLMRSLEDADFDDVVRLANEQISCGADIIDVNVGVPGIDEVSVMADAVEALLATTTAPIQIDSSDCDVIEYTLRRYPGKAIVNSVNGKESSLRTVLPVAAKYGASIIGLTLDESGIAQSAKDRLSIARRIVEAAEKEGIPRSDIAIDCLVMSAATNQDSVIEILKAIKYVKAELGVKTVLGVSNISHGLPERSLINSTFLAAAFGAGLDLAIVDPTNERIADTVSAYKVLNAQDVNSFGFIERYADRTDPYVLAKKDASFSCADEYPNDGIRCLSEPDSDGVHEEKPASELLEGLVLSGRADALAKEVKRLLGKPDASVLEAQDESDSSRALRDGEMDAGTDGAKEKALWIINELLVPALDEVSIRYDEGKFFLPQLLASSEAVKAGFDVVKAYLCEIGSGDDEEEARNSHADAVILATVEGDIHDIGKNIVKMLLQNYGFDVIDLGKDVSAQTISDAVSKSGVRLVGLSALMTTTLDSMRRTIELLKKRDPDVKIMVGGAVLTRDYADEIGADYYSKDASASVRIAKEVIG